MLIIKGDSMRSKVGVELSVEGASGTMRLQKVAIVEDNYLIAKLLAEIIKGNDLDVVAIFTTATDCLENIVKGLQVDVIISDYDMEGINGIEFFKTLDEIAPWIKKVLVTGNTKAIQDAQGRWSALLKGKGEFNTELIQLITCTK